MPQFNITLPDGREVVAMGETPEAAAEAAIAGETAPEAPADPNAPMAITPQPMARAVVFGETGDPVTDAQAQTFRAMEEAKALDLKAQVGSPRNPYGAREGAQNTPGWFVDQSGQLMKMGDDGAVATSDEGVGSWLNTAASLVSDLPVFMTMKPFIKPDERADAFRSGAASGFMFGGKNETIAAMRALPAFFEGGPEAAKASFNQTLQALDEVDQGYMDEYPLAHGAGAVTGSVAGIAATGGAAGATLRGMGAGGRFLAGATGGSGMAQTASRATAGMLGGAAAGGAQGYLGTEGTAEEREQAAQAGALLGAGVGAALPVAGAAGRAAGIMGEGAPPNVAALAQRAEEMGINLRAGQITQTPTLRFLDSVLTRWPGAGYARNTAQQRTAFNRAVAETIGEDISKGESILDQAVMSRAKERIGKQFDDVAARAQVTADDQLVNDLAEVETVASQVPGMDFKAVSRLARNILGAADKSGVIGGAKYQQLTRKGTPLDLAIHSSDPNVRYLALQIRGALDDALERSAAPEDIAMLRAARQQYKNLKTIEPLAAKGGGDISPALLLNRVLTSYPDYAYRGAGDLGDLAQIGQKFLKEPPSSGTSERQMWQGLIKWGGLGGGAAGVPLIFSNPNLALGIGALGAAGAGGSALLGRLLGATLNNPFYKRALTRAAKAPGAARPRPVVPRGAAAGTVAGEVNRRRVAPEDSLNPSPFAAY